MEISELLENPDLLEVARLAIENELISLRDSRIAILGRANGLVVKEKNGQDSHIIRMTIKVALEIGIKAIVNIL